MMKASGTAEEQRAIAYLQWTGWLQDHDKQIYEQGKRDGIEERKTGKWKTSSDFPDRLICSECSAQFDMWHWEAEQMHYCPKCGAKMEGAEE